MMKVFYKTLLSICVLTLASNAQATNKPVETPPPVVVEQPDNSRKWISNDKWTGADKNLHFLGGMAIGGAVTLATEKPLWGAAAGCGVGLGAEVFAYVTRKGVATTQDAVVTCLGSALGAYTGHTILYKTNEGYKIEYHKKF